jgi:hypothetical protein
MVGDEAVSRRSRFGAGSSMIFVLTATAATVQVEVPWPVMAVIVSPGFSWAMRPKGAPNVARRP